MAEKVLKITVHGDVEKFSSWREITRSLCFERLSNFIIFRLKDRLIECNSDNLYLYWIDDDNEEIEIKSNLDCNAFESYFSKSMRLYMNAFYKKDKTKQPKAANSEQTLPADDPSTFTKQVIEEKEKKSKVTEVEDGSVKAIAAAATVHAADISQVAGIAVAQMASAAQIASAASQMASAAAKLVFAANVSPTADISKAFDFAQKSDDLKNNRETSLSTPITPPTNPIPNESSAMDLSNIAQNIDRETIKTVMEIFNNFNDMFAKLMFYLTNTRKGSVANTNSSVISSPSTSALSVCSKKNESNTGDEKQATNDEATKDGEVKDKICKDIDKKEK